MNYQPEIAIVEANTLTCLGLKGILEEMIPMATIRTFHHFSELMDVLESPAAVVAGRSQP